MRSLWGIPHTKKSGHMDAGFCLVPPKPTNHSMKEGKKICFQISLALLYTDMPLNDMFRCVKDKNYYLRFDKMYAVKSRRFKKKNISYSMTYSDHIDCFEMHRC